MKIQLEQIKGSLRERVDIAISKLESQECKIVAFFLFNDIDHQYSWRSKGKYIAIRYNAPHHGFQQYDDKAIFLKTKKQTNKK
jgi:hypothetical protein